MYLGIYLTDFLQIWHNVKYATIPEYIKMHLNPDNILHVIIIYFIYILT